MYLFLHYLNAGLLEARPVERGGRGEGVFPGPATFGGPRRRSQILKMVFQVASF